MLYLYSNSTHRSGFSSRSTAEGRAEQLLILFAAVAVLQHPEREPYRSLTMRRHAETQMTQEPSGSKYRSSSLRLASRVRTSASSMLWTLSDFFSKTDNPKRRHSSSTSFLLHLVQGFWSRSRFFMSRCISSALLPDTSSAQSMRRVRRSWSVHLLKSMSLSFQDFFSSFQMNSNDFK